MRWRTVVCVMVVFAVCGSSVADVPQTISYQGVLKLADGNAVPDGNYDITFRLYDSPAGRSYQRAKTDQGAGVDGLFTAQLWEETQQVAVVDGHFNAILGSVTPLSLPFDIPYWLGTQIGGDPELEPRIQLAASPYSFIAATVADGAVTTPKLVDAAVTSAKLDTSAVTAANIAPGAVGTSDLADAAITEEKLVDGAVGTAKLGEGAVTSEKILDGTIAFDDVAPNNATMWQVMKWNGTEWIADDDFGVEGPISAVYGDAGLTGGGDNGIVPISIAEEGVEESMLQADAVTSGKIEDGTILFGDLGQNAAAPGQVITWSGLRETWTSGPVTGEMIDDGAITAAKLNTDAVETDKIQAGAVTAAKLNTDAVETDKIQAGAVTAAKLNTDAVETDKIQAAAVTAAKIQVDAVETDKIQAAAVTAAKLNTDAVETDKIQAAAVTAAKIHADAVETDKIADGTILFADLGPNDASDGQIMKWSGTAWGLSDDMTGADSGWLDTGTVITLETLTDLVGVGVSAPSEKLDVDGNIRASGKLFSGGYGTTDNSITIDGEDSVISSSNGVISFAEGDIVTTGRARFGPEHDDDIGEDAFVAGKSNTASGQYSTIGGGKDNVASGLFSAVGGGGGNSASGQSAVVCGGGLEEPLGGNWASGRLSFIGGGHGNRARGDYSVVGGGGGTAPPDTNAALGDYCVVAGGRGNTAGTFETNRPPNEGSHGAVGGGFRNVADGNYATVPGGANNRAFGEYSFAAGHFAEAMHNGAFVWADQQELPFSSTQSGQFLIRAYGGVGIGTASPGQELHVEGDQYISGQLGIGDGALNPTSQVDIAGAGSSQLRLRSSFTPSGTGDPSGNIGDIAWSNAYFYVKTAAGWKRAALSTF